MVYCAYAKQDLLCVPGKERQAKPRPNLEATPRMHPRFTANWVAGVDTGHARGRLWPVLDSTEREALCGARLPVMLVLLLLAMVPPAGPCPRASRCCATFAKLVPGSATIPWT